MKEWKRIKRWKVLALLLAMALGLAACNGYREKEELDGEQVNRNYPITLGGETNERKIITGQRNNKEEFKIPLPDYDTVRLNQTEFYDLTGDSQMELCVGLDIANTAVSELNSIYVYDSTSLELLFPTEDRMWVYDGKIVGLKDVGFPAYGIECTSFTKEAGISFIAESSIIGWGEDGFTTLKYKKKLLDMRGNMAVFLKDYSCYKAASSLKLSVERIGEDGEIEELQEIMAEVGAEADLTWLNQKIEEGGLVYISEQEENGERVIVVRPCGEDRDDIKEIVYEWDVESQRFELVFGLSETDLSGWCGTYHYDLYYPPNIFRDVDLDIYKGNNGIYYGYLQASGFQLYKRLTVLIKGNEKRINIYGFDINPDTETYYQKGDFLFSLKKDGTRLLTRWEAMYLDERTGEWEEQFEYSGEGLWRDENFSDNLKTSGFDRPFYQYYDESGDLEIELYYDEERCRGAGIGTIFQSNGFWFEGYRYGIWEDEKNSTDYNGKDGSDSVEDYKESREYNASGRMVHYKSEGTINWLKDNPGRYPVIEIKYEYRENGTLCKKEYSHNPHIFGTTNQHKISYYDSRERLEHVSSYITHGSVESYYIYEGDSREPSYCLVRDSAGGGVFIKYKLYEVIEAKG